MTNHAEKKLSKASKLQYNLQEVMNHAGLKQLRPTKVINPQTNTWPIHWNFLHMLFQWKLKLIIHRHRPRRDIYHRQKLSTINNLRSSWRTLSAILKYCPQKVIHQRQELFTVPAIHGHYLQSAKAVRRKVYITCKNNPRTSYPRISSRGRDAGVNPPVVTIQSTPPLSFSQARKTLD